jgi:monoamine oxidase
LTQDKVIIVGGGLAGLYAAYKLERLNIPYTLLEAKPALGGRILGVSSNEANHHAFDLGPAWIFPHQVKIQNLLKALSLKLFQQFNTGDVLYQLSGLAQPRRVASGEGMELYRIEGGLKALVSSLISKINTNSIKLNTVVCSMHRDNNKWCLQTENGDQYSADRLLLALPPRMISQHLTPSTWASESLKSRLDNCQTWMAAQAKFVATYQKPFWRERGLSGQSFSQTGPMVEMHDACSVDASNEAAGSSPHFGLFGFIGIPARQRANYSEMQIKQACIEQLTFFYGNDAADYTHCYLKDWAQDGFVASSRDIAEPSRHSDISLSGLTEELDAMNLHLCGSEFATSDPGYLEGAIDAVDQVL